MFHVQTHGSTQAFGHIAGQMWAGLERGGVGARILGFRVKGSGFSCWCRISGLGFRVYIESGILDFGFRVYGPGFTAVVSMQMFRVHVSKRTATFNYWLVLMLWFRFRALEDWSLCCRCSKNVIRTKLNMNLWGPDISLFRDLYNSIYTFSI